jgi:hypothetical protein
MKSILTISIAAFLWSCNNEPKQIQQNKSTKKDTTVTLKPTKSLQEIFEDKVTDTLVKLDFIHKRHLAIDSISNHKHGITFITDSVIDVNKDVFVRAGFNRDDRFETYYQFYVNPKTMQIKVYDVIEDVQIPLDEYIKKTKQE